MMTTEELNHKVALLFKSREVWRARNDLINLRQSYGMQNGYDEIYARMQVDINQMADEAEALEQGIDLFKEGSDNNQAAQLREAGLGSGGAM